MNENDKDWFIRSQYLQKFGFSWWPFLHEYLPGLPKLVPLVILEAIKDKSFRYILTCIQVSALKELFFILLCLGNVWNCFNYKRTLLHNYNNVSWVMELLTCGYKIGLLLFEWPSRKVLYFVNQHNARYIKLANFDFSKSICHFKICLYYLKNNILFIFLDRRSFTKFIFC